MKNKSEKGVTLIALTITIIVLLILTSIIITNGTKHLRLKKVNNLEVDIESISSKITDYYLKNESLPIFHNKVYFSNNNEFESFLINKGVEDINSIINPNDEGHYYVIDLSKIEGLTLNYGEKYKDWANDSSTYNNLQDIYIINETSHQIYFPRGIKYSGEYYFTTTIIDERVDAIELGNIEDGIQILLNNKVYNKADLNEIVTANITINFSNIEDYRTDNMVYAWADSDDEEIVNNLNYSGFSLDNEHKANISSLPLNKNLVKHFIFIKIMDKNGVQRIKKVEVKKQVYAIVYSNNSDNTDLELVFNSSGNVDPNRTMLLKTDDIIESHYSDKNPTPWNTYTSSIKEVTFEEEINPRNTSYWFNLCGELAAINNVKYLDTSYVTDMQNTFSGCGSLQEIDVSNFDTRSVNNMKNMFHSCSNLTEINVNGFKTNNVTNMYSMFRNCSSLLSLDLTNFDTSKVTSMERMFENCGELTNVNLSSFNTTSVKDMQRMFHNCTKLLSLDVTNFDTSNVGHMEYMFDGCSKLEELNVSNFNTTKVTSMNSLFYGCSSLATLNLDNFNTSNVNDMTSMFGGCKELKSLDLSNFITSKVNTMETMFFQCIKLNSLNISSFNTSNVTNMKQMFGYCDGLASLDLTNFNTSNVTNMIKMFYSCNEKLTTIYVGDNWDISNVTESTEMFYNCEKLRGDISYDPNYQDKTYATKTGGYMTYRP